MTIFPVLFLVFGSFSTPSRLFFTRVDPGAERPRQPLFKFFSELANDIPRLERDLIRADFWLNVRNPNHHYFSKKYRNTPPICIAIRLQFVPQCFWCPYALRKGKYCQYSSHLYRSTPPICIAIRLPFVSQCFWENLGGCGHRNCNSSLVRADPFGKGMRRSTFQ